MCSTHAFRSDGALVNANLPTLTVEDIKTYFFTKAGIVKAVDGVSLSIDRGEILGLVGESGSGKTVTGFSIMGLVDPPGRVTAGRVIFDGQDIAALPENEMRRIRGRRIAMSNPSDGSVNGRPTQRNDRVASNAIAWAT